MGAHGWAAGIASHGSVSLSRGWLISVEAPRHPGHLSSIQLDAVVNSQFRKGCCSMSNQAYLPRPKSAMGKSIHPCSMASARPISNNRASTSMYKSYLIRN